MQITLCPPGQPELGEDFVLMHIGETMRLSPGSPMSFTLEPDRLCGLCSSRPPVWVAHPATNAAMNPDASPIDSPDSCAPCLNTLLDEQCVQIINIEPAGF